MTRRQRPCFLPRRAGDAYYGLVQLCQSFSFAFVVAGWLGCLCVATRRVDLSGSAQHLAGWWTSMALATWGAYMVQHFY
jgi:hypothetical protein